MNRYKRNLFGILLGIVLLLSMDTAVSAAKPLDEIEKETIWLNVQSNGSVHIIYEIDWKVLDSTTDGPLTWVKIGIPNEYVEEMTPLSGSIEKMDYYGSGGDYVRLDLNREYHAGETVKMKFAILQHRMYEESADGYQYHFTPGWFDDIAVKELLIFWKYGKDTISGMQMDAAGENYFAYHQNLQPGGRVDAEVFYPAGTYQFNDDYKKSVSSVSSFIRIAAIFTGVFGLIIYAVILYAGRNKKEIKDSYKQNRGLGSVYVSSSGHRRHIYGRGGGCACACACACACTGGGRVGCSRKDFYKC